MMTTYALNEKAATQRSDRAAAAVIAVLSAGAVALIAYILLFRAPTNDGAALGFMPAVNASFNALSTALIIAGVVAIKRGLRDTHKKLMLGALGSSTLFLIGYLVYHYVHGDTRYPGEGALRSVYLFVLASHVILSIAVVPLVMVVLYLAWNSRFIGHKRIAKVAYPIWLYVSVTGVLIYFMLAAALEKNL